jgi:hypothetical protein
MEVLALRLKEASLQLRTQRRGQPMGQPQAASTGGASRGGAREQAATVYLSKHLFTLFKDNLNPVRATREKKVAYFLSFLSFLRIFLPIFSWLILL